VGVGGCDQGCPGSIFEVADGRGEGFGGGVRAVEDGVGVRRFRAGEEERGLFRFGQQALEGLWRRGFARHAPRLQA